MPPLTKRKRTPTPTSTVDDERKKAVSNTKQKVKEEPKKPPSKTVVNTLEVPPAEPKATSLRSSPKKKRTASPQPVVSVNITKLPPLEELCSTYTTEELSSFASKLKGINEQSTKEKKRLEEYALSHHNINLALTSPSAQLPVLDPPPLTSTTRGPLKLKRSRTNIAKEQSPKLEPPEPQPRRGAGSKDLSRLQGKSVSSRSDSLKKDKPKPPRDARASSTKTASTSKPSIPNQVSITTFWNSIDQYFKPMQEEHLKWLELDSIEMLSEYFIIPPLGSSLPKENMSKTIPLLPGTLSSRLLAGLVEAHIISPQPYESVTPDQMIPQSMSCKSSKDAIVPVTSLLSARKAWTSVEERIKRDLASLGILSDESLQDSLENDEICGQLRQLQSQLRLQCILNNHRKKKLLKWILGRCAAQEYYQALEILNKQIETAYLKRFKHGKKKKKPGVVPSIASTDDLEQDHHYSFLYKKKLLIESFGDLIPTREQLQLEANSSCLFNTDEENEYMREEADGLLFPILSPDVFQSRSSSSLWNEEGMMGLEEAQNRLMSFDVDSKKKSRKRPAMTDQDYAMNREGITQPTKLVVKLPVQMVPHH